MNILSIQSHVAYGHAGNSAAVFPLQRLGIEVWAVPTVVLSNHTGYPTARGSALPVETVAAVIDGIAERGAFARCDAVLSGYVGDPALAAVIADAVHRVKAANPRARYCCDPVMGNDTAGRFVKPGVEEAIRESLLPLADILTPNRFELSLLSGTAIESTAAARAAAERLRRRGTILACTSLTVGEGMIAVLACDDDGGWLVETPRLPVAANGAGDAFAAIFTARLLAGDPTPAALAHAVSAVWSLLEMGGEELALVTAQAAIADPPRRFAVRPLQ